MENIKRENKQMSLKKRELLKLELEQKKSSKSSDHEKVRKIKVETSQQCRRGDPVVQK